MAVLPTAESIMASVSEKEYVVVVVGDDEESSV